MRQRRSARADLAGDPSAQAARALAGDKLRGLCLGVLAGEALGSAVDGLDRDAILRRHGRLVHRVPGSGPGPLTAALAALAGGEDGGDASGRDETRLVLALGRAALAPGGAPLPPPPTEIDDRDGVAQAEALLAAAARLALDAPPLRRLDAGGLLAALAAVAGGSSAAFPDPLTRGPALESLRRQTLSPPPPAHAAAPYEALPPLLRETFLVLHALLARPRSSEEAVVYAVNLGGAAALRGALTGGLAGLHRGAAALPARWIGDAVESGPLIALAGALAGGPIIEP